MKNKDSIALPNIASMIKSRIRPIKLEISEIKIDKFFFSFPCKKLAGRQTHRHLAAPPYSKD